MSSNANANDGGSDAMDVERLLNINIETLAYQLQLACSAISLETRKSMKGM